MLRLEPHVQVMAIISLLEGRGLDLQIIMVLEGRSRMAQDETNQVVDRVHLRIRFNGFEENWFLLRKPFFITL